MEKPAKKSGVQVPLVNSFFRWNASAMTATTVDKSVALGLHYAFGVDELIATPIGMFIGSVIAFFLGRNWTFISKENKISNQGMKFFIIALGNMSLNWLLVWFFRDFVGIEDYYIISPLASVIVGLLFSFPMQRYFVYK